MSANRSEDEFKSLLISKEEKKRLKKEAKMQRKMHKAAEIAASLGYSNDNNPFGDPNLDQKFVWIKKLLRDAREGISREEREAMDAKRREEVQRKRAEREVDRKLRDEEKRKKQREIDGAFLDEWQSKQVEMELLQMQERARIRIKENRPKPIDLVAINLNIANDPELAEEFDSIGVEVSVDEPYIIFKNLALPELEETLKEIDMYRTLEKDPGSKKLWESMYVVCHDELEKLRFYARTGKYNNGVHDNVMKDIEQKLENRSLEDLSILERQVRETLNSGGSIDVEYWEALSRSIDIWKHKAYLKERHAEMLAKRLEQLKDRKQKIEEKAPTPEKRTKKNEDQQGETREEKMVGDMEEDENVFNGEHILEQKDKYRPRKPKYLNRVLAGFEWNRYNSTHYDEDNPPPKIVRGYKFNIFYPDLIDKTRAPTYEIIRDEGYPETVILKFSAGPPYEDIAFRIVNKDWETSHKRGFRSSFDRGVLQLHFWFKEEPMEIDEEKFYESFRKYLSSYIGNIRATPSLSRSNAKDKLSRLSKLQFHELATDVYDEMTRRIRNSPEVPFLQVRDDFHPKRNQARQKLATLPAQRFKDLAFDVYSELERRAPYLIEAYLSKYGERDGSFAANEDLVPPAANRSLSSKQANASMNSLDSRHNQGGGTTKANPGLDNLMQDLGSFANVSESGGAGGSSVDLSKETRDKAHGGNGLQAKVEQLEKENQLLKEKIPRLEDELGKSRKAHSELETQYENLTKDYEKLKESYMNLQEDFNQQQQIGNDIRNEATQLLDEIKNLQKRNEELVQTHEEDGTTIQGLQREIADLKNQLQNERSRNSTPATQRSSGPLTNQAPSSKWETSSVKSDSHQRLSHSPQRSFLSPAKMDAYEQAVNDLLKSTRSTSPTDVLVAMKAIVIACKNITEEAEQFERSNGHLIASHDKDRLAVQKTKLSTALQSLMAATKNHATNYGNSPVSMIETSVANLSQTIYDLLDILAPNDRSTTATTRTSDTFELEELKAYLERQTDAIVQAIQALLFAMRSSDSFDFQETVGGITSIVDSLVKVSFKTLQKPALAHLRRDGEAVLQDLSSANDRLEELGKNVVQSQSKQLKQKLAGSSYEIAKYVKELISLLE